MIYKERYIWLFFLVGSLLVWQVLIPWQVQINQNSSTYGPAFFPNLLAIAVLLISAFSFIGTFFNKDKKQKENAEDEGDIWKGVIVFAITTVYVFTVEIIHFIPASIIAMTLIMWVLSVRKWYYYLLLVILIFLISYIFQNVMYIQLP